MKKYNCVVIGIDQSYKNTGISISADGKLLDIKNVQMDRLKTNTQRRRHLARRLDKLLQKCIAEAENIVCVVERTRVHGGQNSFINIDAIKAMGALTAIIVDQCAIYDVPVFSVDTRSWKSQVVGTSKPKRNNYGVPDKKWPTVKWVCSIGFANKIIHDVTGTRKVKGTFVDGGKKYQFDDDAADSAGICMYWWIGDKTKLQEEK